MTEPVGGQNAETSAEITQYGRPCIGTGSTGGSSPVDQENHFSTTDIIVARACPVDIGELLLMTVR